MMYCTSFVIKLECKVLKYCSNILRRFRSNQSQRSSYILRTVIHIIDEKKTCSPTLNSNFDSFNTSFGTAFDLFYSLDCL